MSYRNRIDNNQTTTSRYKPSQDTIKHQEIISRSSILHKQPTDESNKVAEIWRLRCKLMAEKYFGIIKDLKKSLSKLKEKSKDQIAKAEKKIGN